MYFLIINLKNETFIFKQSVFGNSTQKSILDLYKEKNDYIGSYVKSDILFLTYYMKSSYNENDIIYNRNIKILNKWAQKLGNIFSEEEIIQMKNQNFDEIYLNNRIYKEFFIYDTEIWFTGPTQSGASSIISLIPGVNRFNNPLPDVCYKISKMKEINRKIMWKDIRSPLQSRIMFGFYFLKNAKIIFIVLDSSKISNDKKQIDNIIKTIKVDAPNSKLLIIANKQDLKEAKSPQEIEGIFHFPTVGFSAIDPNAVKNFEKIVYDFFSNH